ncbi:MAG: phosphatidylglycerophosphatase A [Xanthomonadales bacterium]|nr:phosphatidylglycerophosphatase A [Xanthomonadales bacterium]
MSEASKSIFSRDPALRRMALRTSWGFLATGFGSGLFRSAPGTAGTVVALPIAAVLAQLPTTLALFAVFSLFAAGVYICRVAAAMLGQSDPGAIVWDEIVGFCLVAALVPDGWPWLAAAFVTFRFFDIVKPWPIRALERRTHGGFGIMIDDVVAAFYAVAVLRLIEVLLR